MKQLFDQTGFECSKVVTKKYSTSFSLAVNMLSPKIREDIYSIYAFVRVADEIVDSFHGYDKNKLINYLFKNKSATLSYQIYWHKDCHIQNVSSIF